MNGDQGAQKPGQQYTPNDSSSVDAATPQNAAQAPTQQVAASPPAQAPMVQQPSPAQPPEGFYRADSSDEASTPEPLTGNDLQADDQAAGDASNNGASDKAAPPSEISWTAGGDTMHAHTTAWRLRMVGLSLLLGIIVFIITSDWFPSGSIVIAGLLFGLLGSRRSQTLAYQVDARGVMIGQKHYAYGDFRAFSVFGDRSSSSIELVPLQRFMPAVLLHLDQVQGQQIVDTLSSYLPMQPHRQDVVDHIINSVRI